jgi:hypothetical protein
MHLTVWFPSPLAGGHSRHSRHSYLSHLSYPSFPPKQNLPPSCSEPDRLQHRDRDRFPYASNCLFSIPAGWRALTALTPLIPLTAKRSVSKQDQSNEEKKTHCEWRQGKASPSDSLPLPQSNEEKKTHCEWRQWKASPSYSLPLPQSNEEKKNSL